MQETIQQETNQTENTKVLITVDELKRQLCEIKGTSFVTLIARTKVRMRKTGNPLYDKVFKISRVNGTIGFNYETSVNRQRGREEKDMDFEAMERAWGYHVTGPFIRHHEKDGKSFKEYLRIKVEKSLEHSYILDDGNAIEKDRFAEFEIKPSPSNRQDVEKEVIERDYSWNPETILELHVQKQQFVVAKLPN